MVAGSKDLDTDLEVRNVPWPQFRRWFVRHFDPGEHVFVVGMNGTGKSWVMREIYLAKPKWSWVILDAKGGADPSLDVDGFRTITKWPPSEDSPPVFAFPENLRRWFDRSIKGHDPERRDRDPVRVRFAPPKHPDDAVLRGQFEHVLRDLYMRGTGSYQGVAFDEGNMLAGMKNDGGLGLYARVSPLFRTKRFEGTSLVIGTQYPSWTPPSIYNEVKHRFIFYMNDTERQKRMGEIMGLRVEAPPLIRSLPKHTFLYQHTDPAYRGILFRSKVDKEG
jgi:hypothetical protein